MPSWRNSGRSSCSMPATSATTSPVSMPEAIVVPQKAVAQALVERLVEQGEDAEHAGLLHLLLVAVPALGAQGVEARRVETAHDARLDEAQDGRPRRHVDLRDRRLAVAHLPFPLYVHVE